MNINNFRCGCGGLWGIIRVSLFSSNIFFNLSAHRGVFVIFVPKPLQWRIVFANKSRPANLQKALASFTSSFLAPFIFYSSFSQSTHKPSAYCLILLTNQNLLLWMYETKVNLENLPGFSILPLLFESVLACPQAL